MAEKKILVVDDEKAIISLLEQAFSRKGYAVRSAMDAETALEILENETIYVMFFDLNLPGMNGIELCREIKKRRPVSVIYAITGYASLFELADCRDAGFEDYFKKPVNLSTLMDRAASAFEKIERWKSI
ncbi:MAG: response regulator [Desulfotignum sp.]|jgi:DNA-binding response OmpR family regulator|nr:response regulator [Desulfotignum sp.]